MKCLISFILLNKFNFPSNMDVFPFTRAVLIEGGQYSRNPGYGEFSH